MYIMIVSLYSYKHESGSTRTLMLKDSLPHFIRINGYPTYQTHDKCPSYYFKQCVSQIQKTNTLISLFLYSPAGERNPSSTGTGEERIIPLKIGKFKSAALDTSLNFGTNTVNVSQFGYFFAFCTPNA